MKPEQSLTLKQRFWYDHIIRAREYDSSLAAYAKQENIDLKAMYNYQSMLRQKGVLSAETKFTRVTQTAIVEQKQSASEAVCVQLHNGHRIEVPIGSCDLGALLQMVNAL